jgi:uncharacterized protein (DUF427 family)
MIQRIPPQAGQESVWDYPRPPRVDPTTKRVQVVFNGVTILDTTRAIRILETSHPPTYYLPPDDFVAGVLVRADGTSYCEFKGQARYWSISVNGKTAARCAWSYPRPLDGYQAIADYVALYAGPMDACYVAGERVTPQEGGFYGGWITSDVVGPFKGAAGTWGW